MHASLGIPGLCRNVLLVHPYYGETLAHPHRGGRNGFGVGRGRQYLNSRVPSFERLRGEEGNAHGQTIFEGGAAPCTLRRDRYCTHDSREAEYASYMFSQRNKLLTRTAEYITKVSQVLLWLALLVGLPKEHSREVQNLIGFFFRCPPHVA